MKRKNRQNQPDRKSGSNTSSSRSRNAAPARKAPFKALARQTSQKNLSRQRSARTAEKTQPPVQPEPRDFSSLQPVTPQGVHAEVLAPAGNMEALQAAIAAGADAVYMGLPQFGARAYAQNFTLDQVKEVIEQAHLAGMKIYITMNTLIEDSQIEAAYEQALALYNMGVDALILQDLGLIHYLHHRLPDLELHASTQLSVLSPAQIEKLKSIGISRVVLAREASLDEIKAAAQTGMELEVFVHGALCISYSGQCQFSRIRYGRSGNKGACAQPCRMEYTLYEDGKPVKTSGSFLLSPKDLSILPDIPALEKAGVASLKIEGRMKSPEYVYTSVQKARKAQAGIPMSREDEKELMVSFNRGYTRGHTFEQTGSDLMNASTSNHRGIPIGEVLKVTPDKITFRLKELLHQNDGIRFESERASVGMRVNFLYKDGRLVNSALPGDIVEVDAIKGVWPRAAVHKTVDSELEKFVDHAIRQTRRQSDIRFVLENDGAGTPLILHADDGVHTVQVQSGPVQAAVNRPTTKEDFIRQLKKTGNTWAHPSEIDVRLKEDIFVGLKDINQLRTEAIQALEKEKLTLHLQQPLPYEWKPENPGVLPSYIEVQKPAQKEAAVCESSLPVVSEFPLPDTLRKIGLHHAADSESEKAFVSAHLENARFVDGMNVTNSYALAALLEMGYEGAVLSQEISEEGLRDLLHTFKENYGFDAPLIAEVYEKPRLMLMQHCPVNTALKDGSRKDCSLCRSHDYVLEGKDGLKSELYGSPDCRMRLYDETARDQIDEIASLQDLGIHAFKIDLTTENAQESRQIVMRFARALNPDQTEKPDPS